MRTRAELVVAIEGGARPKFLFFWGHSPKGEGVDASCLSQWFPRAFEHDGVRYETAEHFMMAGKPRLFRDDEMLAQILASRTPAEAKALGRSVRDYDDVAWGRARSELVVQ